MAPRRQTLNRELIMGNETLEAPRWPIALKGYSSSVWISIKESVMVSDIVCLYGVRGS